MNFDVITISLESSLYPLCYEPKQALVYAVYLNWKSPTFERGGVHARPYEIIDSWSQMQKNEIH